MFRCLIRIIPHDVSYVNNSNEVYNEIDRVIGLMNTENDGIFSYRYLMEAEYKDIIIQSMKVNMGSHCDLKYADSINGKDVLVFDDAIGVVGVVSESADVILKVFYPKSITFVTLY